MEYIIEFGLFTGKALIIVIGLILVIGFVAITSIRHKDKETIDIEDLSDKFKKYKTLLNSHILNKKALKKKFKDEKKQAKKDKKDKNSNEDKKTIFVLHFEGDIKASGINQLRNEVSAILSVAKSTDEVVACIESPGGVVHGYGLAASQLLRIREHKIPLTICVDKVAASGGYMMACTGDKILAAPFAIMGSIGVIAQVPNLNKLLKKHDIDYQEIKAGQYKRTLSLFGEVTNEGKQKFTEQIQDTHNLFKDFVKTHRPIVEIDQVATGEYWFGERALKLKLVDELKVSDEYLFSQRNEAQILKVSTKFKKKLVNRISEAVSLGIEKALEKFIHRGAFEQLLG